jgi:1-acyl-sn-glycerol-3-phosphate acyltransferase
MFYTAVCFAVRLILGVGTRSRVDGADRIPHGESFMLVCNHLNLVDPPVLGALLRRRIVFMAKEELFHVPLVGWVVKWYGAFSVRRGQADRTALRRSTEILRQGGVLGVFPEGTRSKTGKMIEAHPGVALIALMSGALVLPVAITGTDRIRSLFSLFLRPRITVRIGEPFRMGRHRSDKASLAETTREIMGRVAALLPEDQRGVYAEDAREVGPASTV